MAAAVQFFVSYPETGRKSLEEIEELFRKGGLSLGKRRYLL